MLLLHLLAITPETNFLLLFTFYLNCLWGDQGVDFAQHKLTSSLSLFGYVYKHLFPFLNKHMRIFSDKYFFKNLYFLHCFSFLDLTAEACYRETLNKVLEISFYQADETFLIKLFTFKTFYIHKIFMRRWNLKIPPYQWTRNKADLKQNSWVFELLFRLICKNI